MSNDRKITEESNRFSDSGDSHDLPKIASWFSENILCPELLLHTGSKSFQDLVLQSIKENRKGSKEFVVVSLGAGHGQIENDILQKVDAVSPGDTHFYAIDLFSPNDTIESNINGNLYRLTRYSQDINKPVFPDTADLIIVHHALHHFVELEDIFESIYNILTSNAGTLVIADMVGRNGHMRWPESLYAISRIWWALPEEKQQNNQFNKRWSNFENWDCSAEGFEGIRSEDILKPLFKFFESSGSFFWGGVLDPFLDRGFGDNFDPSNQDDLKMINNVLSIENEMTDRGYLTPTQVIGRFKPRPNIMATSFTNFLISKKYFAELLPNVQNEIDEIVSKFFPDDSEGNKLMSVENRLNNRNLKPFFLSGWDDSEPSVIWGIGLESKMAFSPEDQILSGILIESYILERAKYGQVNVLINDEINIKQSLTSSMFIHLPAIPIISIAIKFTFTNVEALEDSADKRLITFCISDFTLYRNESADIENFSKGARFLRNRAFKWKLLYKRRILLILPFRILLGKKSNFSQRCRKFFR
jgi:SAM-dependent methyltransferase